MHKLTPLKNLITVVAIFSLVTTFFVFGATFALALEEGEAPPPEEPTAEPKTGIQSILEQLRGTTPAPSSDGVSADAPEPEPTMVPEPDIEPDLEEAPAPEPLVAPGPDEEVAPTTEPTEEPGELIGATEEPAETPEGALPEEVTQDETVNYEDLGVGDPKILPGNVLYGGKNLWRGIRKLVTTDPVKKAELELQFANEKIMEAKKLGEKKGEKATGQVKKIMDSYRKDLEKIEKRAEALKEKVGDEAPRVDKFLDKITDNVMKHQKVLDKLEDQVGEKNFDKFRENREKAIEHFGAVMTKVAENQEKVSEKIVEVMEQQKGSDFKEFKQLEFLERIKEKMPKEARQAIESAKEQVFDKMKDNMENFDETKRDRFNDYVENIRGNEVRHLEVIQGMEAREMPDVMREVMEKAKVEAINRFEQRMQSFEAQDMEIKKREFLRHLEDGKVEDIRIIKELENNLEPDTIDKILEIKNKAMGNLREQLETANTEEAKEKFSEEMEKFHDVKQLEMFKEMEKIIPADKKDFFEKIKNKAMTEMRQDINMARTEEERRMKFQKLAGDDPQQIKIIQEFGPPQDIMREIMKEQVKKLENRIENEQDAEKLEFLKKKIEEDETIEQQLKTEHPYLFEKFEDKEQGFFEKMDPNKAIEQINYANDELTKALAEIETANQEILMRTPASKLMENAKRNLEQARQAYESGQIGPAFGPATAALHEALNIRRMIKESELREESHKKDTERIGQDREKFIQEMKQKGEVPEDFDFIEAMGMPPQEGEEFIGQEGLPEGPDFSALPPEIREIMKEKYMPPPIPGMDNMPKVNEEEKKKFLEKVEEFRTEFQVPEIKELEKQEKDKVKKEEIKKPTGCNCPPGFNPVCGQGGVTYQNRCYAECANDPIISLQACSKVETKSFEMQKRLLEPGHPEQKKQTGETPKKDSKEKTNMSCTMEYDPVCGRDSQTYPNACQAKTKGVEIDYWGPCGVKKIIDKQKEKVIELKNVELQKIQEIDRQIKPTEPQQIENRGPEPTPEQLFGPGLDNQTYQRKLKEQEEKQKPQEESFFRKIFNVPGSEEKWQPKRLQEEKNIQEEPSQETPVLKPDSRQPEPEPKPIPMPGPGPMPVSEPNFQPNPMEKRMEPAPMIQPEMPKTEEMR